MERFEDGATVTIETLFETGLIGDLKDGVKILGNGELTKKLTVRATQFSKALRKRSPPWAARPRLSNEANRWL